MIIFKGDVPFCVTAYFFQIYAVFKVSDVTYVDLVIIRGQAHIFEVEGGSIRYAVIALRDECQGERAIVQLTRPNLKAGFLRTNNSKVNECRSYFQGSVLY